MFFGAVFGTFSVLDPTIGVTVLHVRYWALCCANAPFCKEGPVSHFQNTLLRHMLRAVLLYLMKGLSCSYRRHCIFRL